MDGARHGRAAQGGGGAARRPRHRVGAADRGGARHRPPRRIDRRGPRRGRPRQHQRARRSRRRDQGRLPQAPHVRRRGRRRPLRRVRARDARRGGRAVRAGGRDPAGSEHLLRHPLPRALPRARGARSRDRRDPERVHAGHHARPLGGARAGPRDREPVLRDRGQPGGRAPARPPVGRPFADRRSLGGRAGRRDRRRDGDRGRSRSRAPARGPPPPACARPSPARGLPLMAASGAAAVDKRRVILDAAVRVFARQGFHTCRVADIADAAGVAYGLVYHYFSSKDEILDTLFLERWSAMLAAIEQADASPVSAREKLYAIAAFIIDSYQHDPELMKVIIVEVTRAANTFGRTHLAQIREAYSQIASIVADGQAQGTFRPEIEPAFAALAFYGLIEQVLTGWIFASAPVGLEEFERAKRMIVETICRGLERAPAGRDA